MNSKNFRELRSRNLAENDERKKHVKTITKFIYAAFAAVTLAIGALTANVAVGDLFASVNDDGENLLALPVLGASAETPEAFSIQLVTTFDYPGSGNSTVAAKISDFGDIVGSYVDSSGVYRGFIRFGNGNFSPPIVDPNDTGGTAAYGINNSRLVCGDYLDAASGNYHGFFWRAGRFHNFDVPASSWTVIFGLNNAGDFCGNDISGGGVQSAFFSVGGVITEFTVPQAIETIASQINSSNQVCGSLLSYYPHDNSFVYHGYFRDSDGAIYAPIDFPGAMWTFIDGNNDSNWMVGEYYDSDFLAHGFLFIPPNRYITYDYPGSTDTHLVGINAQGLIVGYYQDASGIDHGIIARVVGSATDQSILGVTPQRQSSQAGPPPSRSEVEVDAF
jgi:hypothetical protein